MSPRALIPFAAVATAPGMSIVVNPLVSMMKPWVVIRQNPNPQRLIDSLVDCGGRSVMPAALLVMLRSFALICGGHRAVALENLALRQQLAVFKRTIPRPPLRPRDRLFWVLLAHAWRNWRSALIVVRPETVVCWHRHWLRRRWTGRSTSGRRGRPRTATAIRTLVAQMGAANRLWGAPRIHGELSKLGIDVSERTVSRLLRRRHRPPSQTWRTFLTNHVTSLVSMDFFTVPTLTGRVLFVLVVLAHHRRRIVHLAITEHPTAAWTEQQVIEAFPNDTAPRWLLRDRDAIYGNVGSFAAGQVPLSPTRSRFPRKVRESRRGSSAGFASHARGHRFESYSAHHRNVLIHQH
jgi:putative transposase